MKIMKEVNGLKVYSREDVLNETIGKIGTKERNKHEIKLQKDLIKAQNKQNARTNK